MVECEDALDITVLLRVPDRCEAWQAWLNDGEVTGAMQSGYLSLQRVWKKGDRIRLRLDIPPS